MRNDLTKSELKAVLIAGHLIKRDQLNYAGMTQSKNEILGDLDRDCQRAFGLGVYASKNTDHVIMGQLDQTRAFLTKLTQKMPDQKREQDHKLELLQIVLQV